MDYGNEDYRTKCANYVADLLMSQLDGGHTVEISPFRGGGETQGPPFCGCMAIWYFWTMFAILFSMLFKYCRDFANVFRKMEHVARLKNY